MFGLARLGFAMCSAKVFEAEAKKQPSVKAMMDDIVRCSWRGRPNVVGWQVNVFVAPRFR